MVQDTEEWGGTLLFRIWVTRGCYFVLSDRLKRKARYSVGSITVLSFYVFIITFLEITYADSLPAAYGPAIPTVTVILSVFIIIITLLEHAKDYRLEAEYAQQTAHSLEKLYGEYEAHTNGFVKGEEAAFSREYTKALTSAKTTRRTIDYILFQLTNAKTFELTGSRKTFLVAGLIWNGLLEYWLYGAMVIVPPLAALLLSL